MRRLETHAQIVRDLIEKHLINPPNRETKKRRQEELIRAIAEHHRHIHASADRSDRR